MDLIESEVHWSNFVFTTIANQKVFSFLREREVLAWVKFVISINIVDFKFSFVKPLPSNAKFVSKSGVQYVIKYIWANSVLTLIHPLITFFFTPLASSQGTVVFQGVGIILSADSIRVWVNVYCSPLEAIEHVLFTRNTGFYFSGDFETLIGAVT